MNEKQSESKWRAHSTASLPQIPAIAQQKQEVDADLQLSKICKQGQLEAEEQARSSHACVLNHKKQAESFNSFEKRTIKCLFKDYLVNLYLIKDL